MGTVSKTIVEIPIRHVDGIDRMFGRKMKMDTDNVPKKMLPMFEKTRTQSFEMMQLRAVYESYEVEKIVGDSVYLTSGDVLDSRMYANMFRQSSELVFCVVSVSGFEAIDDAEDNMLGKLFLDSWGSSIVEAGSSWLKKKIEEELSRKGVYGTNSFSPGQHEVPMELQTVIFKMLCPEEIGVTLNSHYLMNPKKSVSEVFGIGKTKLDHDLKPCDFCERRETCFDAYTSDFLNETL